MTDDADETEDTLQKLSTIMQGFTKELLAMQAKKIQARAAQAPSAPQEAAKQAEDGVVRLVTKTESAEANCVKLLSELLERAKRGEFREFAFAATGSKDDSTGHVTWTHTNNEQRLLGQVLLLERLLVDKTLQRRGP